MVIADRKYGNNNDIGLQRITMAIQPKFSLKAPPKTAQRFFTDRTEPRQLFAASLASFDSTQHLLIHYYGMGGIGKTRLTKELISHLEKQTNWYSLLLDMEQISFHDCGSALVELRNQARRQLPKLKFTSFDFAYAIYWQRLNPSIDLNERGLEQLENSDLLYDIANGLVEGMEAIPGLNVVTKVAMLAKKSGTALNKWWLKRGSEQLATLETLPSNSIKQWLPAYFAADIQDYLEKKPDIRLCLFMDTYEALWDKSEKEGQFFEIDEWARELVSNLPQVLFVIAGREKLRWEEVDQEWDEVVDSHVLQRLSNKDSSMFLERCGVDEPTLVKTIVESSDGSPFYLDLAVDSFKKILKDGRVPSVDDFIGKTHRQILDRFVRYLDRSESATLKVLALCRQYDHELFSAIVKRFGTGYSPINMPELNRYSFIQEVGLQEYSINPLMKRALVDHFDPMLHNQVLVFLFEFHRSKIGDFASEGVIGFKHFEEAKYYAKNLQLEPTVAMDFAMLSGQIYQYQSLMDKALVEFERACRLPECDLLNIQNIRIEIATTQRQNGNINEALDTIKQVLELSRHHDFLAIEGKALVQQGLCLFSRAQTQDQPELYKEAFDFYQQGLRCAEKTQDMQQVIYTKITMSTVIEVLGEVTQACDLLVECQSLAEQHGFKHLSIDCLNGLARKYLILAEYQKAIDFAEKGLLLWRERRFYRGQLVMCCHLLKAHFHLGHQRTEIADIIKEGDSLNDMVTESLLKHMYQQARSLW